MIINLEKIRPQKLNGGDSGEEIVICSTISTVIAAETILRMILLKWAPCIQRARLMSDLVDKQQPNRDLA